MQRVLASVACARYYPPVSRKIPVPKASRPRPDPPLLKPLPSKSPPAYKTIADVTVAEIRRSVTEVLVMAGGTDPKDLTRSVARQLGFERTGKNIEKRITEVVEGMMRAGHLAASSDDGNVRVVSIRT